MKLVANVMHDIDGNSPTPSPPHPRTRSRVCRHTTIFTRNSTRTRSAKHVVFAAAMLNETLPALAAREFQCPVQGQPDLYGLGIRVGIYIQMLAVQVSALLSMVLRQDDWLGEGVVIFILAVGSVLVKLIVNRQILAVEAAPMMALLLAQVGVCRSVGQMGLVLGVVYAVELCGLSALFVWFWWHGMDVLGHSPCPDDKAFFFASVSLWGWFRTMNKVFAIFTAIGAGIMAIMYIFGYSLLLGQYSIYWIQRLRGRIGPLAQGNANQQHNFDDDDDNDWNIDIGRAFEITVNIGVIAFVEMTLKWNNITGVHSLRDPGQFMPLMIALAQLLAIIYQGASRFAHLVAVEDEPGFDGESDETECTHEDRILRRRRNNAEADQDGVELA
ncbi:hypothetical protein ISF_05427 [Cordyceps fumosorosea ARSEF 2679]|uniref:Uncharacterized protein n=1 Tax=Cordyceps fumosorosea (strain ARSEF 2679) TaxID=1081104 RepID=A0A167U923_CORFA|nr:hypothetical protein ISF_05427 [Cordyceps fumosorosea ARSEF 2679]OAA61348.1 hypothetical protein ISF_05427 [Cordyceps fumosorosea ARSEF 2679]